jgi:cell division protein FtsB
MPLKKSLDAAKHWLRPEHPKARRRRALALLGGAALAWAVLGGQQGLFALLMSQREKARLASDIDGLRQQNAELQQQLAQLQSHPEAYERTARERLLLMRPGETIYRFR